ncbi:hypothetical protein FOL47_000235 [Perkinsus chesapeaki]|uniref:Uncharacterized protein n=1 Tax=Perkinsus chesapeaki TaxID=330153 RepID=A0A7J6MM79_PERCH|nr:hypothetical protein FOL47_000235 [Perkinsus chesapeaki]
MATTKGSVQPPLEIPLLAQTEATPRRQTCTEYLCQPRNVLIVLALLLCIAGSINDVSCKIVQNIYGQDYAFFVDQFCNVGYMVMTAIPAMVLKSEKKASKRPEESVPPQYKFAIMGLLDGLGTLLSSIGGVSTPGQFQTVLNQTLIPVTMVCSALVLGTTYSMKSIGAASIVFISACITVIPSFSGVTVANCSGLSVCLYFLSNIPMALSNVYKESGFSNYSVGVWTLTAYVAGYQTIISFGLGFLQCIPYLSGQPGGVPLAPHAVVFNFLDAFTFSVGPAGALLLAYCVVNLVFNVLGVAVTRYGSALQVGAIMCSLAYAVKLPVSSLLYTSSFLMGKDHAETFSPYSLFGVVGVTIGFILYVRYSNLGATEDRADLVTIQTSYEEPWGFHERVVGCVSSGVVPHTPVASRSGAAHFDFSEGA